MNFMSYSFAAFFIAAFALFSMALWLGRKRDGIRPVLLFLLSAGYMLAAGGLRTVFWFAVSGTSVWWAAGAMERAGGDPGRRKRILLLALALNFGLLAVFQYINFPGYTLEEFSWLMGRDCSWTPIEMAAPLAVSYYTLAFTGYLLDVCRQKFGAQQSLVRLLLFGGFFPQMSVGPVADYGQLQESLYEDKTAGWEDFLQGGRVFLWGLFKKLVISERLAMIVDTVYADPEYYSGSFLVFAAACFTLQLYTDFGGAVDMAAGLARIFGVRLARNFSQPFASRSVAEFWRRWHITLGAWCREHIYIPLGGNRRGLARQIRNIFVVWLFTGLWHGGRWTFIIGVGLFQACVISIGLLARPWADRIYAVTHIPRSHPLVALFQRLRTFVLVSAGFVWFRSDSLSMALEVFCGMGSGDMGLFTPAGITGLGLSPADLVVLALGLAVLWAVSHGEERKRQAGEWAWARKRLPDDGDYGLVLGVLLAFVILVFGCYGQGYDASAFIYSRF